MAEKTMTATFTASSEAIEKLFGTGDEYIVKAPWERIRWCLKDGTVKESKQDIRERIVRCRNCTHAVEHRSKSIIGTELVSLICSGPIQGAYSEGEEVPPDGFCAWGERCEA